MFKDSKKDEKKVGTSFQIQQRFENPLTGSFDASEPIKENLFDSQEVSELASHISTIKNSAAFLGEDIEKDMKILGRTDKRAETLRNKLGQTNKEVDHLKKHRHLGLVRCLMFGLFCLAITTHYSLRIYRKIRKEPSTSAPEVPPPPPTSSAPEEKSQEISDPQTAESIPPADEGTHQESDETPSLNDQDIFDFDTDQSSVEYQGRELDPLDSEHDEKYEQKLKFEKEAIQEEADLPL